jgi:nucleotide-binding universal stress UspA family protein
MAAPIERLERILLATDGSAYSRAAEATAAWLARKDGVAITALQAVIGDTGYPLMVSGKGEHAAVKDARDHMEALCRRMEGEDIRCESIVAPAAEPFRAIVDRAAQEGADLIVMGRRDRNDLSRLMMGDNTAKVIGHAPCPVLVVPRGATVPWHGIVVATDGSEFSRRAVLTAGWFSRQFNVPLRVLAVVTGREGDPDAAEARRVADEAKIALAGLDTLAGCAVERGRPDQVIVAFANRHGADLVVVGSHGRTGLSRLLVGSVSERAVGHFDGAVTVVR